ncbi:hypothetical protein Tco_0435166 [Tanacetum coccineum]
MEIPKLMLAEEMKLTAHYRMYASIFRVYVPTTQSHPIESTQGTHITPSSPRTPNPDTTQGESSTPCKPTIIRFRIQSQLDLEMQIPTSSEIDVINLKEATQIEKLVKGDENVDTYEFMDKILNTQKDPDTRLEFGSQKESPKKGIEEIRDTPIPTPIRSPGTYIAPLSSDKETIQELMASTQDAPSSSDKEKLKELMASDYIK